MSGVTPLAPEGSSGASRGRGRAPLGIGRRGVVLLAAGLVWIVPAWVAPETIALMLVWDVVIAAAWITDLRRLPAPDRIRLCRGWSGALGLGTPTTVTIDVENHGAVAIRAHVVDTPADSLIREALRTGVHRPDSREPLGDQTPSPQSPMLRSDGYVERAIDVAAGRAARLSYDLVPNVRGDAQMGDIVVRYESNWGLAARWVSAPLAQTVRVYPNLRDAQRHALALVRTPQVEIERRRARHRGFGREFDRLREFQDGDEPRDICWTATARRGRVISKVYQPERSQAVWLMVDAGRLSRARIGRHAKLDHTVNAALALAHVAMLSGDRVGLLAYGQRAQQRVAPGRGAAQMRTLVDALAMVRGETVEGDHLGAAHAVMSMQSRRALIVWLTEIAETAGVPDVVEGAQRMAPRHLVVLAVPQSPELAALAARRPATAAEMYRVMAAQETAERRESLIHSLRQRRVVALEWAPGELSAVLVNRYMAIKERNLL